MANFIFTGDPKAPGTDPDTCEMGGVVFPYREVVEVDDKNKDLIKKMRTHTHFTEGDKVPDERQPEPKPAKTRAAKK